jgi:NAD(P)H-nitrite reductase large subunit
LLKSRLEECGVQIETGCQLQKIAHGGHYVDTLEITLSSGKVLTGDFLLISAGMSPRTAAAAASGIACKNGILVDNQMKTSAPDVYAAGDCAESETPNYCMWISAKDQGEALGNIITGKLTDFVLPARTPVLKIGQLDLTGIRSSRP